MWRGTLCLRDLFHPGDRGKGKLGEGKGRDGLGGSPGPWPPKLKLHTHQTRRFSHGTPDSRKISDINLPGRNFGKDRTLRP